MSAPPDSQRSAGFSLVEVLVALTIVGMAGAALLLATETSLVATDEALEQTVAQGIAQTVIDDCLGRPYTERGVSPLASWLGRDAGENAWPLKSSLFDDTDDFEAYFSMPIHDAWAFELGQGDDQGSTRDPNFRIRPGYFQRWFVQASVRYVDEDRPSEYLPPGQASGSRAIEVQVGRVNSDGAVRFLTAHRRVFSYVPPPS